MEKSKKRATSQIRFLTIAILCLLSFSSTYEMNSTPVIGISIGTTSSCVGVQMDDRFERIEIVPDEMGNNIIPYYFTYSESLDQWLVGEEAKNYAFENTESPFYEAKILGDGIQLLSPEDKSKLEPNEIPAIIISKMKSVAENYL